MKKIISLLLAMVTICLMLVSCNDKIVKPEDEYPDYNPPETEVLSINLYIPYVAETDADAKSEQDKALKTVQRRIQQYTTDKYMTTVNITYIDVNSYVNTVLNDAELDKFQVALVISEDMMYSMLDKGLLDLTPLYATDDFGKLNKQIPASLLAASKITTLDENGAIVSKLYSVPNNRVLGEYEYLLIDKAVAQRANCGTDVIASFTTAEAAITELTARLGEDATPYVRTVKGNIEDKMAYEANGWDSAVNTRGCYCNIVTKPVVTPAMAFESAWVVMASDVDIPENATDEEKTALEEKRETENKRRMEIVYALNTDKEFHDFLTFGIKDTHYTVADGINDKDADDNVLPAGTYILDGTYAINPLYTGDMVSIKSYVYANDYAWTEADAANAVLQNLDSSVSAVLDGTYTFQGETVTALVKFIPGNAYGSGNVEITFTFAGESTKKNVKFTYNMLLDGQMIYGKEAATNEVVLDHTTLSLSYKNEGLVLVP